MRTMMMKSLFLTMAIALAGCHEQRAGEFTALDAEEVPGLADVFTGAEQFYSLNEAVHHEGTVEANAIMFCTCKSQNYNSAPFLTVLDLSNGNERVSYQLVPWRYNDSEYCKTEMAANPLCANALVFKLVQ
jgi:hypothetical protein